MSKKLSCKSNSIFKTLLTLVLVCICFATTVQPTFAASTNNPYGFTYDEASSGKTMYKYYTYNSSKDCYSVTREFYSKGNTLCKSNGAIVTNESMGSGARYNGFTSNGNFYFISKANELIVIDTDNKVTTLLSSGATKLQYDSNDLVTCVSTTTGNKYLPSLDDAPEYDDTDNNVPEATKASNRVDIYTNSANELVYDAYKNGSKYLSIVTSSNGKKVLNSTASVRLSDVVVGAKFMGLDANYNVYLYETNGTLYRFKYGNWYSPEKISLASTFKSFKTDDNGFVSKVVTSKSTYTIDQLTASGKWKASKTYVVQKSGYCTLYTKGKTTSNTLTLVSGKLSLNGKTIATKVSKYGFISAKKLAYIKSGKLYTASISKATSAKKVLSKASSFKKNSVGLLTKVVLSTGKTKKLS